MHPHYELWSEWPLILIAILFSSNRRAIKLRTVGGAFLIQIGLGAFVLYSESGRKCYWLFLMPLKCHRLW